PNSIRNPRIFTCKSFRPKNSIVPSAFHLPRSPVLYIRASTSLTNGSLIKRSWVNSGRFRYPRATPAPPMYNSPVTPIGTGSLCSSRMYTRVFAIGRPMCAANGSSRFIATHVEYVVVSDGPYRLHTFFTPVVPKICSTSPLFNGSPAKFTTRTLADIPPASTSAFIAEGTVLIRVTSIGVCAKSNALPTILTLAPTVRGARYSYTAKSKLRDVENRVRSRTSRLKDARAQETKLTAFRCSIATPLGIPVDPEV